MATKRPAKHKTSPEQAIAAALRREGFVTTGVVVAATGLSRQAVHKHLRQLVEAGRLHLEGAGRGAHYVARRTSVRWRRATPGLDEARLYSELVRELPALTELPSNAERILHYAFTELVNNAIDHSRSDEVSGEILVSERGVAVEIVDQGIGVFENVRSALRLNAPLESIGELSKGKTTTDPERHSGQGIFFSSKAVDVFELESGELRWSIDNRRQDFAIGATAPRRGTRVRFEVDRDTRRELRKVFDEYTTDLAFDRTRTIVRLFAYGTAFVSRSEAKRLLHGLEKFREVVLDFAGVDMIGQGFADEVFRVFRRAHPNTALLPVDMLEPVEFMVRRALADA